MYKIWVTKGNNYKHPKSFDGPVIWTISTAYLCFLYQMKDSFSSIKRFHMVEPRVFQIKEPKGSTYLLLCILMVPFNLNPWIYIWMCWFFDLHVPIFQLIASVCFIQICGIFMSSHTTKGVFHHLFQMLHVWNIYTGMCSMSIHRINGRYKHVCISVCIVSFSRQPEYASCCGLRRNSHWRQTQPTKSGPWDGSLSYLVGGWTNPP